MQAHETMPLDHLMELLQRDEACPMPAGWQQWPLAARAHRKMMREFLRRAPEYPRGFAGRGIVICAGGGGLFTCGYVCARMLRFLGCRLPIQFWHLGEGEMDEHMRRLAADLGASCVDAFEVRRKHPARILNGWELKPFALLHSPFREVLLLDADNVPVRDPTYLFEDPEYREAGAVFWPDYGRLAPDRSIWEICGVPYRDEPEIESGQVLLDKELCWVPLQLTVWMNGHSDYYYAHVHGDKCTYQMAWHVLERPYAMPSTPIEALDATMCQHDFQGRRLFQHRNMDKWRLDGSNREVGGFRYEEQCRVFLSELAFQWSGVVGPAVQVEGERSLQLRKRIDSSLRVCDYQHHPRWNQFRGPAHEQRIREMEAFVQKYRILWSVAHALRPRSILELGVLDGQSADAFLCGSPQTSYLGLDRWDHDPPPTDADGNEWSGRHWVESLFAARGFASARLERADYRRRNRLPPAEFVNVDGEHDYHNERRDLELALTARPRWIYVDDYRGDQGELAAATDFCQKWARQVRAILTLSYCHGGGLLIELGPLDPFARLRQERSWEDRIAGGRFIYRRVGHDERPLELCPGGLVGEGRAGCELSWRVDLDGETPVLALAGEKSVTCRLRRDGRTWKGRWLHYERMPVELEPLRAR